MYSGISQINQYNYSTIGKISTEKNSQKSADNSYAHNPIKKPAFTSLHHTIAMRTQLSNNEEKEKYSLLVKSLDKQSRKSLEFMLKTGTLLNSNSNDKTSTLDNLYKIATTPRAEGLNNETVLRETVNTLANPFVITQQFGKIPEEFKEKAVNAETKGSTNLIKRKLAENDINVEHSGTCVSASIEFNLASKMPAEFARVIEGLSSPTMAAKKEIELKNLTDNTLDSVWLLNAFEVPYEMKDYNKATITLAPDKNSIIRAQSQTKNKKPLERSVVDVLMQSTFMNVGSQQTYDSLSDKRAGKFNQNDRGLIEFEKTFTESVVEDKNKTSITYQIIDDNERLVGYETSFDTMKKHITDSLAMGDNVIVGYTEVDDTKKIINGHEITIVGTRNDEKGNLIFICNDTDDNNPNAIEYPADYIIPKIHHAGLPQAVLANDVKYVENWVEGMKNYKDLKANQPAA